MNKNVVKEEECENSEDYSKTNTKDPESSLGAHFVKESIIDKESNCETTPGSKEESSNFH